MFAFSARSGLAWRAVQVRVLDPRPATVVRTGPVDFPKELNRQPREKSASFLARWVRPITMWKGGVASTRCDQALTAEVAGILVLKREHAFSARAMRQQMGAVHFDEPKLRRLVDAAPAAYRDIQKVQQAQRELVKLVRPMKPVLSYKGA